MIDKFSTEMILIGRVLRKIPSEAQSVVAEALVNRLIYEHASSDGAIFFASETVAKIIDGNKHGE
jgi:hypothetical protein